jgi:peptide/nickel transport system permease protein
MSTAGVRVVGLRASRRGIASVRTLASNRRALLGMVLLGSVIVMALISLIWTPYPATQVNVLVTNLSPRWSHLAGTDELGRDVFSRIMVGARASLTIAAMAVAAAGLSGTVIGFATGYLGGAIDLVVSRVNDIVLAIPALLTALGIVAFLGPSGTSVAIALAVAYMPTFARVIRSNVVAARDQPYVEAARGLGVSTLEVLAKDIVPNVMPIIIVQVTTSLAWAIMDEAALGFLGLGVQPPAASWGSLLTEGRMYMYQVPWLPISAGVAVIIAILGINLLGDGLRDLLDPRGMIRQRA